MSYGKGRPVTERPFLLPAGKAHAMRLIVPTIAMLVLAGCGSEESDGVGGVSASDARALNEAAAKLDAQGEARTAPSPGGNPAARAAARADRDDDAPSR